MVLVQILVCANPLHSIPNCTNITFYYLQVLESCTLFEQSCVASGGTPNRADIIINNNNPYDLTLNVEEKCNTRFLH